MRNGTAIKGDGNACVRGYSRDCGNEAEDGVPNFEIRGFVHDRS